MRRRRGIRRLAVLAGPAVLLAGIGVAKPSAALADGCATVTWTGATGSGQWADAGNWDSGTVPGSADRAVLSGATVAGVVGSVCGLTVDSSSLSLSGDVTVADAVLGSGTSLVRPADATASAALVPTGQVATAGTLALGSGTSLKLTAGAALTASSPTTLLGAGALDWRGGSVAGAVTLGPLTTVEGSDPKRLAGIDSRLSVPPAGSLTINDSGPVQLEGVLDNEGTVAAQPGVTLTGASGAAQVLNAATATLRVDPLAAGATAAPVVLDALPLVNAGSLVVGRDQVLDLTTSATTADAPLWTTSPLADGSTLRGGGTLRVDKGAVLAQSGTTAVRDSSTVRLDDGGDGGAARLDATAATLRGAATSAAATSGSLVWQSGQVRGQLALDAVTTQVGSLSDSGGSGATRRLAPLDGTGRGLLNVLGPLSMQAAQVVVQPGADVVMAGATTFAVVGGFTSGTTDAPDATATLAPTGSLTLAPATIPGLGLTLPSQGVFDIPFVNQGAVVLNASSLSAGKGYTQDKPAGSTTSPTTGLYTPPASGQDKPSPSTLSAGTSSTPANVALHAGILFGTGTVKAATTTVGAAALLPDDGTNAGALRVEGDLTLTSASDVQLVVGAAKATSAAVHDQLTVTGTAVLAGRISGITRTGYDPAYLADAAGALTAGTRQGTFQTLASSPTTTGLGWRPVYGGTTTVDLRLVDIAPPALGLAGIPVVTPAAAQRVTYAAVDNKSGVASYDVRWRRSSPSAVGGWAYPASWQATARTYVDATGLAAGWTYCWTVRARDRAGNATTWSQPLCTTRLADDRAWSASAGWTRVGGVRGFSNGTYSRTTRAGATLRTSGSYTRVAFTAMHCPTCGVVDAFSGATRLARVDLRASGSTLRTWASAALSARTGPVTLRVVTSGRAVVVDAVVLQRT